VLDLTGNGVNLTGESSAAPMFDMNGTGFAVHTGWTQPGTGLLVIENAAGQVANIHQLVGGENDSGFAALAQYDGNNDGVIDAGDPDPRAIAGIQLPRRSSGTAARLIAPPSASEEAVWPPSNLMFTAFF
jgi:hypothetical protein